jgi:hypothetical protein
MRDQNQTWIIDKGCEKDFFHYIITIKTDEAKNTDIPGSNCPFYAVMYHRADERMTWKPDENTKLTSVQKS